MWFSTGVFMQLFAYGFRLLHLWDFICKAIFFCANQSKCWSFFKGFLRWKMMLESFMAFWMHVGWMDGKKLEAFLCYWGVLFVRTLYSQSIMFLINKLLVLVWQHFNNIIRLTEKLVQKEIILKIYDLKRL